MIPLDDYTHTDIKNPDPESQLDDQSYPSLWNQVTRETDNSPELRSLVARDNHFQNMKDRTSDRGLKRSLATEIIIFLFFQTLMVDGLVLFNGLRLIHIADVTMDIIVSATIVQVFGCIHIMVKHLFPGK